jgi:glycosyltransferase involved in cell wall biosynthesis
MMHQGKIKIVHILEGFVGGTSTYIRTVLPELAQQGFDVTLIVSTNRCSPGTVEQLAALKEKGVTVHIISMRREINPYRDIHSFITILRLLIKNDFDIVHTHCSKAGALGRLAGYLAGKNVRFHTPHCFAFTRCNNSTKRLFYLSFEKFLGKLTTKLVVVAQSEAEAAVNAKIVHKPKCIRIGNGLSNGHLLSGRASQIKDAAGKVSLGLDKNTNVVTTACRLVEYKGIFRFIEAAALSHTPNTVFLVAGDGKLKESAERLIREKNLSDKVKLLGHVSNMERVYAVSDVVALCSEAEAQPYILLEAMRAKCPIVATNVPGNQDIIQHERTGLLAEPTPAGIAGAIDEMLADRDKADRLAENAYEYFHEHHTLENQITELTNIYNNLI